MCKKCVLVGRKSKMPFGRVKFFAHQLLAGVPIPIFVDRADNFAIEGMAWKIMQAKTKNRR